MENIKVSGLSTTCRFCNEIIPIRKLLDVVICPQCNSEVSLSEVAKERHWEKYLSQNIPRQGMTIPVVQKSGVGDADACQAVAALMALKYYGVDTDKSSFYASCESAGLGNHVLPWGVLKGAASYGLYAYLVSNNPFEMINYDDVMAKENLSLSEAEEKVNRLIEECRSNEKIRLIRSDEEAVYLAKFIEKKAAVLIPTIVWTENENHSVVITNVWDGGVYFIDPNNGTNVKWSFERFFPSWKNERTDGDIIIISDKEIDFEELAKGD
jgi:hypothetical protein